jgi:hypothetical protein
VQRGVGGAVRRQRLAVDELHHQIPAEPRVFVQQVQRTDMLVLQRMNPPERVPHAGHLFDRPLQLARHQLQHHGPFGFRVPCLPYLAHPAAAQ